MIAASAATVAVAALVSPSMTDAAVLAGADRLETAGEPLVYPFSATVISTAPDTGGRLTPLVVTPADTFSLAVVGFNTSTGNGAFVTSTVDPVFGTTTAYANGGIGGQTLTVSSSESVGASTTTDMITVSVPTNFLPTGTTLGGGQTINYLELDIGEFNGGTDQLNFLVPINPATNSSTGSAVYSGGTLALTPATTILASGASAAAEEALNGGGAAGLSQFAVRQFSYSLTYATTPVPEPATAGVAAAAAVGTLLRRRRRLARQD